MKLAVGFLVFCLSLVATAAGAQTFQLGVAEASQFMDAEVLVAPQPVIPPELHEQCFKSCCIARFNIGPDGKTSVKLLSSSGSEEVDDIALSTLRRWKFRPAMLNGKPVQSTRRVKIEFEVE
ncbi:MAG TPA: energy transducer TonB [Candidatus Obscuribacterales bacterium]